MFGEFESYTKDYRINCGEIYYKDFPAFPEQFIFLVAPYPVSNPIGTVNKIYLAAFGAKLYDDGRIKGKIDFIESEEIFDLNQNPNVTIEEIRNAVNAYANNVKNKIQKFYENRKDSLVSPTENPNLFNEEWTFTPLPQMYLNQNEFKIFYDKLAEGLKLPTLKGFIEYCRKNLNFEITEEKQ